MPLLKVRPRPAFLAKTSHRALLLLTPVLIAVLGGCAVQRPFQFHANSITKISYDPKNCNELPDGTFRCKDVVFTVSTVAPLQVNKPASAPEPAPVATLEAKK